MTTRLRVRGRYVGYEGIVAYSGDVKGNESHEAAAVRITREYFVNRQGEVVDFEIDKDYHEVKSLSSGEDFEDELNIEEEDEEELELDDEE